MFQALLCIILEIATEQHLLKLLPRRIWHNSLLEVLNTNDGPHPPESDWSEGPYPFSGYKALLHVVNHFSTAIDCPYHHRSMVVWTFELHQYNLSTGSLRLDCLVSGDKSCYSRKKGSSFGGSGSAVKTTTSVRSSCCCGSDNTSHQSDAAEVWCAYDP